MPNLHMNLLTIIVCVYLFIAAARGFFRGFTKTMLSMLFLVIVLVLTLLLTPFMSRLIGGSQHVRGFLTTKSANVLDTYMDASGRIDLTSVSIAGRSLSDTPFEAAAAVLSSLVSAAGDRDTILKKLVGFEIGLLSTAVTFALVFLLLLILRFIHGQRKRSETVEAIDHIFGLPVGAARGLVVVWTGLAIINVLAFIPKLQWLAVQVEESPILTWLNQHNLVMRGTTFLLARLF